MNGQYVMLVGQAVLITIHAQENGEHMLVYEKLDYGLFRSRCKLVN